MKSRIDSAKHLEMTKENVTLTIPSIPLYHEQFVFQLDHHPEQPKSLNCFLLIFLCQEHDLGATRVEENATQHLFWETGVFPQL